MESPYNPLDYVTKYFEYKQFNKIYGKPTVESVLLLFRQIKQNSHTVRKNLGGGQLGYLALIIDPTVYTSISGTVSFIRPTDSGVFAVTWDPLSPSTRVNPIPD